MWPHSLFYADEWPCVWPAAAVAPISCNIITGNISLLPLLLLLSRLCISLAFAPRMLNSKLSLPSPQHNLFSSSYTCSPTQIPILTSLPCTSAQKKTVQTDITRVPASSISFRMYFFFCFDFRFTSLSRSILGHRIPDVSVPLFNVYPASKYALTALSQTIRQELLFHRANIKLTVCIAPRSNIWRQSFFFLLLVAYTHVSRGHRKSRWSERHVRCSKNLNNTFIPYLFSPIGWHRA